MPYKNNLSTLIKIKLEKFLMIYLMFEFKLNLVIITELLVTQSNLFYCYARSLQSTHFHK